MVMTAEFGLIPNLPSFQRGDDDDCDVDDGNDDDDEIRRGWTKTGDERTSCSLCNWWCRVSFINKRNARSLKYWDVEDYEGSV